MRLVWIDASSGASGDMLLGALLSAGVPLEVITSAVSAVAPEPVALNPEQVVRGGLTATRCHVEIADSKHHRTWADVRSLLAESPLEQGVRALATGVFERLAAAEAAVHGTTPDEVHFHEVGALDAIADVVGVCAGFVHLDAGRVVVSPVAVGSGSVRAAHGVLPVPPPAVVRLLTGAPSYAGPEGHPQMELCTPTGAALLTTLAGGYGAQPMMTTTAVGTGAGGRDREGWSNALRLMVGDTDSAASQFQNSEELVIEANIDDIDPRLLPDVIEALLASGANDAWLTPILMKKGRPAYTLHALTPPTSADAVRRTLFTRTTTIGVRELAVTKRALPREVRTVTVNGQEIRVKQASLDGETVNLQPEWDDVARAAAALGQPPLDVLHQAHAAARKT
ncbi:MAG: nickel pincer cofactor biosynthesis protein LarC [Nocardioides sp.]|nr:nickel pincer cofactor biosynthesis protein LarC [Nocardioides sp.]